MTDRLSVVAAQCNPCVGDIPGNTELAASAVRANPDADLVVLSEGFLSGYPAEDLVLHPGFLASVEQAVAHLTEEVVRIGGPALIVGAPEEGQDAPYNSAYLIRPDGTKQVARKVALPNYGVFDELRHFAPGTLRAPFMLNGFRIGLGICEEMWFPEVAAHHAGLLADLLVFINGSPYTRRKHEGDRLGHARARVRETGVPLLYVNQFGAQDEVVFDGASFLLDRDGRTVMQMPAFASGSASFVVTRKTEPRVMKRPSFALDASDRPDVVDTAGAPSSVSIAFSGRPEAYPDTDAADYAACMSGLRDYVEKIGFPGVVLGVSGGVDSALAAAIAVDALGADRVLGVTMPSKITAGGSLDDARLVAISLGIRLEEIAIGPIAAAAGAALGYGPDAAVADLTLENIQPRARMMVLMGISNRDGPMVVTTGNKSELSVGYSTLYGDLSGGYNPLKDLYKTEVWRMCRWRNRNLPQGALGGSGEVIPERIVAKPPTAELREGQTDEGTLGPYSVLDEILIHLVDRQIGVDATAVQVRRQLNGTMTDAEAARWLTRDHVAFVANLVRRAEYKRRQSPPGVKLGARAFGRDRRFPIVNTYKF